MVETRTGEARGNSEQGLRGATNLERLRGLWRELGILESGGQIDAEAGRIVYQLPGSLRVGAALGGPGGVCYFFDEDGAYVGFGAADPYGHDHFVERGREEPCEVDYDGTGGRSVLLRGRYAGLTKTHDLPAEAPAQRHFATLPDSLGNVAVEGLEDFEAGDELRVRTGAPYDPPAHYEVTHAERFGDAGWVRFSARRRTEDDGGDA